MRPFPTDLAIAASHPAAEHIDIDGAGEIVGRS
jgi:hypothetical protein